MNQWTELQIKVPVSELERASAIAQMVVTYGIYIEDYSTLETEVEEIAHINLIDRTLQSKNRTQGIIHIYLEPEVSPREALSFLEERLHAAKISYLLDTSNIKEEDWATTWQKYYHRTRVGNHLIICPVWEDYTPENPDDIKLLLNPGMSFGTGTHETTRLCLAELEKRVTSKTELLDIGCGSGILSIASSLLGAKSVVGVDIDPIAVKVAGENAALNHLSKDRVQFLCSDLTDRASGQYDIICANIVADAIIHLSGAVRPFLKPGGIFLCSGIIKPRAEEIVHALQTNGFRVIQSFQEQDWIALTATALIIIDE